MCGLSGKESKKKLTHYPKKFYRLTKDEQQFGIYYDDSLDGWADFAIVVDNNDWNVYIQFRLPNGQITMEQLR